MKSLSIVGSLLLSLCLSATAADPFAEIHAFTGTTDQFGVHDGDIAKAPILGKDGFLYGTTEDGGFEGNGVIYKASTSGVVTVLHSFSDGTVVNDGKIPYGGLVEGADGNFYGTASRGGLVDGQTPNGGGIAFKITPAGVYTIIHRFSYGVEGLDPRGTLIRSADGNFYGTTYTGGNGFGFGAGGTVYKMTPAGVTTMITNFSSVGVYAPRLLVAGVIEGKDGLLYGTASAGGTGSLGAVFSVSKTGTVKILHNFADASGVANDGGEAASGLIQNSDGAFYGVTPSNTAQGNQFLGGGIIYKITSSGAYTILHTFQDLLSAENGPVKPVGGLVKGADGFFYGATARGGTGGTLYKVTSTGALTVLHTFGAFGAGSVPSNSALLLTSDGTIYGTTESGGSASNGVLYKYQLPAVATAPPVISSGNKATATATKAFSYQIVASNAPDSYSSSILPKGLTLNTATGLISGTPSVVGSFNVSLVAKNAKGTGKLTLNIAIAQNTQTITFGAIPNQVVGGKLALTATASSGLPITYVLASGKATLSGRVLTFTGAGTVTVRATQPGNTLYKAAATVSESILVVKKTQTITFGTIPTKVVGTSFTLTAKASSGLAIKYTVSGPATISGSIITLTGAGNVRVTASQAGDATYNAATPITQRFLAITN